ncbi:N-6 DNA methylase [uncultured Helicobacter sp.]|uniref:N-6 DNA methylase n=1 Tax=uncultured Helicobacter sp. TaxID=175537 RepID=UPI002621FE8F|nr:N-6 DNA methylase [uncultured Helicobacter sp.]
MKLEVQYNKEGKIYSPIRKKHLVATPEEKVRQSFVCILCNEYDYSLEQMDEELETGAKQRGGGGARADIVIWKNPQAKHNKDNPLIIVECKADSIKIGENDYLQGELYARQTNAPFFVTHNNYETRFWRVKKDKIPGYRQQISNIPKNGDSDKEIQKILDSLVVFKEDEFANLLHRCHNIIRNIEKLDPAAAFDEIAKILFMKVYVERSLLKGQRDNKFTKEWFEEAKKYNPNYLEWLFEATKKDFAKDQIFLKDEKINLKEHTAIKIIEELQIYNLSLTSTDIKGIAFERFLGRTFRGEIGQFFTPRSIVEFMVEMIDPLENEISCDPASGSGGFLIRIFGKVREDIQKDIIRQYEEYKQKLVGDKENDKVTAEQALKLNEKYEELHKELQNDSQSVNSRLFKLSNDCIFGTDANDRMARTSKMNMIMHGDGHGGIHHHNGLLNINGIFENRFDVILTNPPFGSQVEKADVIQASDTQLRFPNKGEKLEEGRRFAIKDGFEEYIKEYYKRYEIEVYENAQSQILNNIGKPIASLFKLKPDLQSDKTEHLFINRCLDLLKPGGRMGIVLPEGVFNTPNAEYVRKFVEGRAFIRAVVSLPNETFNSAKASVKCSILFLQKFDTQTQQKWDTLLQTYKEKFEMQYKKEIDELQEIINYRKSKEEKVVKYNAEDKKKARKALEKLQEKIRQYSWQSAKNDFDYPIFMAETEFVGITSTGETGENIPNELIDTYEIKESEKVLKQKGITSYFKEFLQEHKIAWNTNYGGKNE